MSQSRKRAPGPPRDLRKLLLLATLGAVVIAATGVVAYLGLNPAAVSAAATETPPNAEIAIGLPAPEFSVSTNAGPFDLAAVKTPVFLEVFATWCPHCQHEVPIIDTLYRRYGSQIQFVGVSGSNVGMDRVSPESQADIANFVSRLGVAYPVAFDPDLTVAKSYLHFGYPSIVIIGTDKRIKAMLHGEVSESDLDAAITAALATSGQTR